MSKEIMDRMKQIQADLMDEVRSFTIDGMGQDGGPLTVYVRPATAAELKMIWRKNDRVEAAVESIVQRARNEKGERLFTDIERGAIERHWPPKYILQGAAEINRDLATILEGNVVDTVGEL